MDAGLTPETIIPASALSQSIQRLSNHTADRTLLSSSITAPSYRIPTFKGHSSASDGSTPPSTGLFAINRKEDIGKSKIDQTS